MRSGNNVIGRFRVQESDATYDVDHKIVCITGRKGEDDNETDDPV